MSSPIPIAVHGATGRMGEAVLRLALMREDAAIVAAVVKSGSSSAGKPLRDVLGVAAGALSYATTLDDAVAPAVLIDFSSAQAFDAVLDIARSRRLALVSGTTGLSDAQHAAMRNVAATIPLLWSANFSLGVAVLMRLARDAAQALADWDCEIAEAHHRHKKDAPSGTAISLGRAVAAARGTSFEHVARFDHADTPRESDTIGFAVTRGGDIVGEHSVVFAGDGERIELVHRATDRDIFARGAIDAAVWLAGKPPGLYALDDMLEAPRR